jgi:uncharacterized protein YlxW (UPF0749 family)
MTADDSGDSPPKRDAAIGLLDRLVRDALDQGYLDAAQRRANLPAGAARVGRWWIALGLALVGLLLAVGAATHWSTGPEAAQRKQELAKAVDDGDARVQELEQRIESTTIDVTAMQRAILTTGSIGGGLRARADALGISAGTLPVTGPGVHVIIDDAPVDETALAAGEPDLGRVLDRDLQGAVNGLWAAGAEAIDINGQRLTSLTAIRGAGAAILVNYRPLVRPYVISALGDPNLLATAFAAGPEGEALDILRQTYGVRYDLETRNRLDLPAETGVTLRYAKETDR